MYELYNWYSSSSEMYELYNSYIHPAGEHPRTHHRIRVKGAMASKTLRERATEVGMKAMGKLFEDPKRAEAIASAIGSLQKAKQAIDEAQERALKAAGLVTREDFKDAGKRLSALKRRCRELADELDQLLAQQQRKP